MVRWCGTNPRSLKGERRMFLVSAPRFNRSPPKGGDALRNGRSRDATLFQSTLPSERRRPFVGGILPTGKKVSIHAPLRRATFCGMLATFFPRWFQSTLPSKGHRQERTRSL